MSTFIFTFIYSWFLIILYLWQIIKQMNDWNPYANVNANYINIA